MKTSNYFKQSYIWAKRTLVLTMLCFLTIASSYAQTETCRQIGDGTSENLDFPISGALSRSYSQQIYKASELLAEDIEEGDNIRALAFNYFLETPTKRPIKIYLGNTSTTGLYNEWISINDLTLVYSSNCQEFSKGDNNWTKITLDTEFSYTGGNIVVAVLMNKEDATDTENCYTNANTDYRFYTHNGGLAISRYIKDGLDIPITFNEDGLPKTNEYLAGNSLQTRSNIKFCKIGDACPKVSGINSTNTEETSITLDWTAGSSETSWTIEYGPSEFTQGEGTPLEVTAHPFEITNLNGSTTYEFYIRANCSDDDQSNWAGPISVSTSCSNISSIPYIENFENYGFDNSDAFPSCWTRPEIYIGYYDSYPSIVSGVNGMTGNCLKFQSSTSDPTYAITQKISVELEQLILEFKLRREGSTSGSITVGIMTDPDETSSFTEIETFSPSHNDAKVYTIKFSDYSISGTNKYIAFKHSSNSSAYYYWLDDVKIREEQTGNDILSFNCPDLIAPVIINNEEHTVTGSIFMSADLTKQSPIITISEAATISPDSETEQDFTNTVDYTVRAETGLEQIWKVTLTNSTTAITEKDILSFTFEGQIGDEIIDNTEHTVIADIIWEKDITKIKPVIQISNYASISPESETQQDFSQPQVEYTVTAEDLSTQTWKITINQEEAPIGGKCENPVVLDLATLDNPHSIIGETTQGFGNVYSDTDLGSYDNGFDKTYRLSVAENSVYSIKINTTSNYVGVGLFRGCPSENDLLKKATKDYYSETDELVLENVLLYADTEYFLMVDRWPYPDYIESYDLSFEKNENPPCSSPNYLEVSDILDTSVKIIWSQALDESSWELKYGEPGFNPLNTGTLVTENVISPFVLTGLTQFSDYSICIRAKCSESEKGSWSELTNFSTLETCARPSEINFSSITLSSVDISWNGHEATNWVIEYKLDYETEFQTVETSTNSYTLDNLNSSSAYIIRLKAKCEGNEESIYTEELIFLTLCGEFANIPIIEEFESYGKGNSEAFPHCWSRPLTSTLTGTIYPSITSTSFSSHITNQLRFRSEPDNPTIAATQIIQDNFENLVVEFSLKRVDVNSGSITIGTMTDPNNPETFSDIKTIIPENNIANNYKIILSDYSITGTNKSIAFKHSSIQVASYYYIDDIKIRIKESSNDIISFNTLDLIAPATIDNEEHTVNGTIYMTADISKQIPIIGLSPNATISPSSGIIQDFTNTVNYTITSETGAEQVWKVTLTNSATASTEKDILAFSFPGQIEDAIIDNSEHTVVADIIWEKNMTNISPIIEISNYASISPESGTAQDFSSPQVEYTLTSEDGNSQIWKITINQEEIPLGGNCQNPVILDLETLPNPHTITGETTEGFGNIFSQTSLDSYDNGPDKIYKINLTENSIYTIKMNPESTYAAIALFKGCPSENIIIKMATNSSNSNELVLGDVLLQANTDYFLMADNFAPNPNFITSYDLSFEKNENPPCTSPNDLHVVDILQTTANITWSQALSEEAWKLKYGPLGFNPEASGTLITDNLVSPYEITGLTENTSYSVFIRSKCSESEEGEWFGPKNFKTLESCPTPSDISFSSITLTSADITWNGYNAPNWVLEYKLASDTDYQSVETSSNTYSLTGLLSSSIYNIKVKAICENNEESSYSQEINLVTLCEEFLSLPYLEDFENYGDGNSEAFPQCWSRPVTYGYSTQYPSIVTTSHMPSKCLKFQSAPETPTFAILPKIEANIEDVVLEFLLKREGDYSGSMIIGIMTDPNNPNTFSELITINQPSNDSIQYLIKFSDFPIYGPNKHIAFKHSSITSSYYYWLDNVIVREKYSGNDIISFNTPSILGTATINNEDHTVNAIISMSSDLTQQTPIITISDGASIYPESETVQDFTNTVNYTVTAENEAEQVWHITLTKSTTPSTENDIISFAFTGQIGEALIDIDNSTISALAKWTTDITSISPTIGISNFASISPESESPQNFTNPVQYTVTAEDVNVTKIWTVNITLEDNPCSISFQTPFLETFDENSSSLECWTIIDNNNDGEPDSQYGIWTIDTSDGTASYKWNSSNDADDWLVSPKINIPADAKLKFNYKSGSSYVEKFSVYVIQASPTDIENATNILPSMTVQNSSWQTITPISLSEYAEQEIFLAIKCESESDQFYLYIKDFTVSTEGDNQFKITSSAENNGSIEPLGDTFVNMGASQSYTITPDENYQIDKVLVDGTDKTSELTGGNTYTFTQVNANHNILAKFKAADVNTFKINASVLGGNGSITPTGEVIVQPNQNQSFTITPNQNYQIDKVLVDEIDKTNELNDNVYTFENVQADHTIKAKFKAIEGNLVTIIASVDGGNGSISPSGTLSIVIGENQSFVITPNANYQIDKVTVDNIDKTNELNGNVYTFENVQTGHTIKAKFKPAENTYTITCSVHGGNGSISPTSTTLAAGENLEITVNPNNGYILNKLIDNTIDKSDDVVENSYMLTNIQENHNIVAKFEVDNSITDEALMQIRIYPNPTNDVLNIEVSEEISKIEITTLDGKLIHKQNVKNNKYQYSTNALAEGNYFIKIFTADNKLTTEQFSVIK